MPTYLTQVLEISDTEALIVIIGVMLGMMLVIAPVGALSDRVGRKPLLLASAVGFLALSYPAIALVSMRDPLPVTVGMVILAVLLVLMLGTIGSALPAMFPTRNRYGGFSIGYSVVHGAVRRHRPARHHRADQRAPATRRPGLLPHGRGGGRDHPDPAHAGDGAYLDQPPDEDSRARSRPIRAALSSGNPPNAPLAQVGVLG